MVEATQDIGRIDQGAPIRSTFALRNVGGLDLSIDQLRAGCGCTATASPRSVPPMGEAHIEVVCDTSESAGAVSRNVMVYSNDPLQPVTTLTVTADVQLDVVADPPEMFVGRVRRAQEVPTSVRVLTRDAAPVTLDTPAGGTVLRASLTSAPAERRLRMTIKPDAPLGPFEERVKVRTSSQRFPVVAVTVRGTVEGDVVVSPSQVRFGLIPVEATVERVVGVRNRGGAPVRLTGASLTPPVGDAEIETVRPGEEYRVVIRLVPRAVTGRFEGNLELRTDHPEQSRIVLPFSGRVGRK